MENLLPSCSYVQLYDVEMYTQMMYDTRLDHIERLSRR